MKRRIGIAVVVLMALAGAWGLVDVDQVLHGRNAGSATPFGDLAGPQNGTQDPGLWPIGPSIPEAGSRLAPADDPGRAEARTLIETLPVTNQRAGGYDRDLFGQSWSDDHDELWGHDGCDTRNNILARDLDGIEIRNNTNNCVVVAGTLLDPYSGQTQAFTKARAGDQQVDHVVALSAAWQMGANAWTTERRQGFANDPLNLVLVDGGLNQSKSDSSPGEWMPPDSTIGCGYVWRYAAVSAKYALPVTADDQAAMVAACN